MATATKKKAEETKIVAIQPIKIATTRIHFVGVSPMIMHRFPKKAQQELLMPSRPMNRAEKASVLKHDPIQEFRESIYINRDKKQPTAIHVPSGSFARALANTALDIPGASKAQMLRLTSVVTEVVNIWGLPKLYMRMVRLNDISKTPDVRTRAVFAEWAGYYDLRYVSSLIKENAVHTLAHAGGVINGIGDWRSEKGGQYGAYRICDPGDAEYKKIIKEQGRQAQLDAIAEATPFDDDSEELLAWFQKEAERREHYVPSDHEEVGSLPPLAGNGGDDGEGLEA